VYPNQLAAGAKQGDGGLKRRDVVRPIAEMALQLIQSLGHRGLELGEPDAQTGCRNPHPRQSELPDSLCLT
jgi:hypothetical protein